MPWNGENEREETQFPKQSQHKKQSNEITTCWLTSDFGIVIFNGVSKMEWEIGIKETRSQNIHIDGKRAFPHVAHKTLLRVLYRCGEILSKTFVYGNKWRKLMWIYDGYVFSLFVFFSIIWIRFVLKRSQNRHSSFWISAEIEKRGIYFLHVNWMRAIALEHDRDMYPCFFFVW